MCVCVCLRACTAELYQRWRAQRRPALFASGPAGATLAVRLAQRAGPPGASATHTLHQAMGLSLELQDAAAAYAPWTSVEVRECVHS